MEQIMKNLEDPDLRKLLEAEFRTEDEEQAAFEKRLRAQESIPAMAEIDRKGPRPRRSPALQQAIRKSLRGR